VEKRLDFIERLDFEAFVLPENWYSEKKRIDEKYGKKPPRVRHIRGPVTLAMSVYGAENLIYLMLDAPELAKRFSDSVADVILKYVELFDREADYHEEGFSFADDQCCMLNPELYEFFGYPILKKVFETVSPTDGMRYQHSDSDMGHLIPILGRLNFTAVNFGPNIMVKDIRPYMPKARIDGCMAPFTFMRNDHEGIIREIRRDADAARGIGGLNIATAGSINNGSSLESMRVAMHAIQTYGRY
jgi:uroporphyrinogen decarboxylase